MIDLLGKKARLLLRATETSSVVSVALSDGLDVHNRQHGVIPMDHAGGQRSGYDLGKDTGLYRLPTLGAIHHRDLTASSMADVAS